MNRYALKRIGALGAITAGLSLGFQNCSKVDFRDASAGVNSKLDGDYIPSDGTSESDYRGDLDSRPGLNQPMPEAGGEQPSLGEPDMGRPDSGEPEFESPGIAPAGQDSQPVAGGSCGNYEPAQDITPSCDYPVNVFHGSSQGSSELYAFGIYNVASSTHGWLDSSPWPTHFRESAPMEVKIPSGSKDISLLLFAYEPTVWSLTGDVGRVKSIEVVGYHCQTVEGETAGTSVSIKTYEQNGFDLYSVLGIRQISTALNGLTSRLEAQKGMGVTKAQYTYEGLCIGAFEASPK